MEFSDWSEYFLRRKLKMLTEEHENLEKKISAFEKRIHELELTNKMIVDQLYTSKVPLLKDEIWIKIRGHVIEKKDFQLLNPSRRYKFRILDVSDDYIRVDKLGKVKLTKEMFISVYDYLKNKKSWVRIGASVRNTKRNTVEGFLKTKFYEGDMNAQMTAPWISAILVNAGVSITFNNEKLGQAIRYYQEP